MSRGSCTPLRSTLGPAQLVLWLASRPSILARSSVLNAMSTSRLASMRDWVTDFGNVGTPRATCQPIATCAADLPCLAPISARTGWLPEGDEDDGAATERRGRRSGDGVWPTRGWHGGRAEHVEKADQADHGGGFETGNACKPPARGGTSKWGVDK